MSDQSETRTNLPDAIERGEVAQSSERSHEELQAIYDGMLDGLLVADVGTKRFVGCNTAMCRMLGYSADEMLSLSVMEIHPRHELPRVLESFTAQAEGWLSVAEELPVLRKDGSVFYADVGARSIVYRQARRLIGMFRDVTERRRAREALERERRVLRDMLSAQDRERQLVAYDIHDGLAQQLAGAIMQFESSRQARSRNSRKATRCYNTGLEMLRESLAEARRLIGGLRPLVLDELGVVAAITHLIHDNVAQGGPQVEFHRNVRFIRLEPVLENAVFRIVQEGLANVRRHSQSEKANLAVIEEDGHVRICVEDCGVGFDPENVREHCFGLAGIRERARVLGGRAQIESAPGKGTRVTVELPLA
jgi:PAS domain S-box-containing protein